MIAQAHARGLSGVTFQEADAEELPFADASFDAVVSNLCLHLVTDADRMLAEVRRVLKPSGRTAMSVWGSKVRMW